MLSFESDYIAGAHPEILKRLTETNLESLPGYGKDHYCTSAKEKIRKACDCPGISSHHAFIILQYGSNDHCIGLCTSYKEFNFSLGTITRLPC